MAFKEILKITEKFVVDNSPGILTGLGVAGSVTTAVLTGKASYSAAVEIESQRDIDHPHEFSVKEKARIVWKKFIPPAVSGVLTVAAIIAANTIGSRRAAAITAAFKISEEIAKEYRERVAETMGSKPEQAVRDRLAAERIARTPGSETIIIIGSEVVFFDEWSGRYFRAEMESVRKAINDVNFQVNNDFYACVTDFYDKVGLPSTELSDEFGWNTDHLLEPSYSAVLMQDGRPAISVSFNKTPIRGYSRVN